MQDFRKLRVWQKAHQLSLDIYKATKRFPKDEIYGLTSQIRRATVSIGANIAEGSGKDSNIEFKRFLSIAMGSSSERENHLLLARDLEYLDKTEYDRFQADLVEVRKMLNVFIQKLRTNN
jgi:four helix bundle protein